MIGKQFFYLVFFLIVTVRITFAQNLVFTWEGGDAIWNEGPNGVPLQEGVYGVKGVGSLDNIPSARYGAISWTDKNGNFWLFGGEEDYNISGYGKLNDLWKYNPSLGTWTWVSGSNSANQSGIYGTKGSGSPNNSPGARVNSTSWTDSSGSLWLFGGQGYDRDGSFGPLNDLWKFDTSLNSWAWISGSDLINQSGIYGTIGIGLSTQFPGAKSGSTSWVDDGNNLWLFGGQGFDINGAYGFLNDVWKYDPQLNTWTWVSGQNTVNQAGVYGTRLVASSAHFPGARKNSITWSDENGRIWLFGGNGYDKDGGLGYLNDLWSYDPTLNNWMWVSGAEFGNQPGVFGTMGLGSASNTPGPREDAISWIDNNGGLWLFGGFENGHLNDLWRYDPVLKTWTWISGTDKVNQSGNYGTKGVASTAYFPGAKAGAISFTDSAGKFYLFGGRGIDKNGSNGYFNDLWKYDLSSNSWTWVSGSDFVLKPGVYGTKGIGSASNIPGARRGSNSWTDKDGNLWLFGGYGVANGGPGWLNDLWKYDPNIGIWTWVSGSDRANQSGVYGTQGVSSTLNLPEPRDGAASWTDSNGIFWLFGGSSGGATHNDLWKYDPATNLWTWVSGSNLTNQASTFGTKGVPSTDNIPSGRFDMTSWTDLIGNLYLFGGFSDYNGQFGWSNDLWKYDPLMNTWTWVSGTNSLSQLGVSGITGVYGTKGVASVDNIPSARFRTISWTDNNGKLWLFGGFGYENGVYGAFNDLWKYDPEVNTWTWVSGSNQMNQPGIYGTKGTGSSAHIPGARYSSTLWKDNIENIWLFGGYGVDKSGVNGYLNDLWRYEATSNAWTWVSGSDIHNVHGDYGVKSVENSANVPGSRGYSNSWSDNRGKLWLLGGDGYDQNGSRGFLNDLWSISFNSIGNPSTIPILCINTPLTTITHSTGNGSTGIGNPVGLPPGVIASWAAGVLSISGTPTVAGVYNYSIPVTGVTGNATGRITVRSINTASSASSTPSICINTVLTNITHITTGATGIGIASGLPAGVTVSWVSNTITISGTPTSAGTFNYTIPLTGGCGSVNATGTIIVRASSTASAASSSPTLCANSVLTNITHVTTGGTGIGTAIGLPPGVIAVWAGNVITISGTPTSAGSFSYTIPLTGGCGSVSATGTITVLTSNQVGSASSSPSGCINNPIIDITHSTSGANGIGTPIGLPSGVTASWSSNTITISGTPSTAGSFSYTIPLLGGCGTVNATGTIIVGGSSTVSLTSAVSLSNQTFSVGIPINAVTYSTTGATGILATGLPPGLKAVWVDNTIAISGTPMEVGTFSYSISLTGGCSSVDAITGVINVMLPTGLTVRDLQFEIYPNPIEDEFKIQVQGGISEVLELKLMDSNGRILLLTQPEEGTNGIYQVSLDQLKLSNGFYLLLLKQGDYSHIVKVIKR